MANQVFPDIHDAYLLINDIAKQATGREDLKAVDTSTFVSVGETLLRIGTENTLNAISTVLADTIFSVRPYRAKLQSLRVAEKRWGAIIRKLVPLYMETEQSEDWNTVNNPTQLADGQSVDMYKINAPKLVQLNFSGCQTLQKHITRFRNQLTLAFRNEREFLAFVDSIMIEFANEVEIANEQQTRLTLVNFFTGLSAMGGANVIDLTAEYNKEYGTSYTRQELLTAHLTSFMQFFVSTVKIYSDRLTDMSALYHYNLSNYQPILRHTPKSRQRMIMYSPVFTRAEASVFSEIFNPLYLELGGNLETVNFWQSQQTPESMTATPSILDVNTGERIKATSAVTLDYVVGAIFDEEALGIMPRFDYASTTPFNSAGGYYNMYYHWFFNSYNDFTENAILFVLGGGGPSVEAQ